MSVDKGPGVNERSFDAPPIFDELATMLDRAQERADALTQLDHDGLTVSGVQRAADLSLADELSRNDEAAAAVLSALRRYELHDAARWLAEGITRAKRYRDTWDDDT